MYEVEFPDGQIKEYSSKMISENMLTQVESDGFSTSLMETIAGFRKYNATALEKADSFVITIPGQMKQRQPHVGGNF